MRLRPAKAVGALSRSIRRTCQLAPRAAEGRSLLALATGAALIGAVVQERRKVAVMRALDAGAPDAPYVFEAERNHTVDTGDGGSLHVAERGRGRPVLMIHGYSSSLDVWAGVARELHEAPFRVLAVDLRGHGSSSRILENASLTDLADDVATVLRELDLDDVICVGHSVGSIICQMVAAGDQSAAHTRISSLVLVSTTARGAHGDWRARIIGRVVPLPLLTDLLARPKLGPLLLRRSLPSAVPYSRVLAIQSTASKDVEARRALAHEAMVDTTDYLARIDVPTRIIVGSRDPITPPAEARRVNDGIRGSVLRVVGGAGHILPVECPEIIAQEILSSATSSYVTAG